MKSVHELLLDFRINQNYKSDKYFVPAFSSTLKSFDSFNLFKILPKCSVNSLTCIVDFFLNLFINSLTVIGFRFK